jgi:hypothetical protein
MIKDITPKVARKFSIELTENQLKVLGIMLGDIVPADIKRIIENNDWRSIVFGDVKYEDFRLYDQILEILKVSHYAD